MREVEACWKEGRRHAEDCDLKSFFDTVNHDWLMGQLREKVRDPKVLDLIHRYLTAGVVLPDGTREATPQDVPQGGPLSPLLANITLDPLDTARRAEAAHKAAGSAATGNQGKRPRTRRRHLLALGIPRGEVRMATRSRKGLPFSACGGSLQPFGWRLLRRSGG
ncbi:MAG: reverse transcriptase domain-containing protein [bacterium]